MTTSKQETTILAATEDMVRNQLAAEPSGHDWWHIYRVYQLATRLAKEEGANLFICQMAALLHVLADAKIADSEEMGLAQVAAWLEEQKLPEPETADILWIIQHISYKAGSQEEIPLTLEAKVVRDADRLDAMGAIGIARTMAYSGAHGRLIHDPNLQPRQQMSLAEYWSNQGTAILHFHEKLLKLKQNMQTKTGKEMAIHRHAVMEKFLEEFHQEWNGKR